MSFKIYAKIPIEISDGVSVNGKDDLYISLDGNELALWVDRQNIERDFKIDINLAALEAVIAVLKENSTNEVI